MIMGVVFRALLAMISAIGLGACGMVKSNTGYKLKSSTLSQKLDVTELETSDIHAVALNAAPKESCSFSSFHRKNTLGYEIDDRRHIGFRVSPSVDVFDPSNAKVKIGLNFTMAFGGPANKRPKCTYGSGYYGLVPYAMNDGVNLGGLTDVGSIKGFVQEKLDERERRRKEREAKRSL